jgi:N-acetylglucosamine transport system substrate-binding protein
VQKRHAQWVFGGLFCLLLGGCKLEPKTDTNQITLEVACFEGGYGLDWHRSVARRYEALHPNIKVNLWGDPRVEEKIRPRVLRGDPPDLASCSLPVWKLILANKLYPLNETLATPAYGQNTTWQASLTNGILADYTHEGKSYVIPSNLGAWVCWYDKKLFREHGWQPPRTWNELLALCEKIKQAGIEPLAFQGKYPIYAYYTLLALYQRLVPFEKWYALQDIQPGAFADPDFVRASGMMQDLAKRYFAKNTMAMSHTESQREWTQRRAALVFCGLWLNNEMKDALPNDFEMSCFAVPIVEGAKGDPHAVYAGGGENFFVFSQAKHPKEGADFLKFMLSMESAKAYTERLDTLSPVKDSYKGAKVSPALQGAIQILEGRSRIFAERLGGLYPSLGRIDMSNLLGQLLKLELTPNEFAQKLEEAAEKIRKDSEIYKPPARGVPQ